MRPSAASSAAFARRWPACSSEGQVAALAFDKLRFFVSDGDGSCVSLFAKRSPRMPRSNEESTMSVVVSCPDRESLRRLLLGHTSGPEAERLRLHLEQCARRADLARTLQGEETFTEAAGAPSGESGATMIGRGPVARFLEEHSFLEAPRQPGEIGWLGS